MINIVLCADERYAPYCAVVMLTTIIHCAEPGSLHFYVLTPGLAQDTVQSLKNMVEIRGAKLDIMMAEETLPEEVASGTFRHRCCNAALYASISPLHLLKSNIPGL